jgi:single-stranded-DNA-specific exonuclease
MTPKKWLIKEKPNPVAIEQMASALNVNNIVAEMLIHRGINTYDEARKFFRPDASDLHDPFLMQDMQAAVNRLEKAIANQENILVYGDYDVDGTTAVTMVYDYLHQKNITAAYYIPDRYQEGYGVSEKGIRFAKENDFTLIITLDCGIKAIEQCALAKDLNIDVIVCDHHQPGEELPEAIVLNPKRIDCQYPYKELSGCGVGFKLLEALTIRKKWDLDLLYGYLDLLAISIGADIVPITGENRTLCALGIHKLNTQPRESIQKMLQLANRPFPLTITDVVFTIAPRINAAGRMGDAKQAVQLLLSKDTSEIAELAKQIHEANEKRKGIDDDMTKEALAMLNLEDDNKVTTVVFHPKWHKGVIGIVASRLIEHIYRPTIVFTASEDGEFLTGSARSIKGIDIHEVLEACQSKIVQFGGHYFAAGLTIRRADLDEFCALLDEEVKKRLQEETLIPEQLLEREIDFSEIFTISDSIGELPKLKRILDQFEPHGPGNRKPVFLTSNVFVSSFKVLKEKHIKLTCQQPNCEVQIDAIVFNRPDLVNLVESKQPINLVYTLESNEWRGKKTLQLNIKDMRGVLQVVV